MTEDSKKDGPAVKTDREARLEAKEQRPGNEAWKVSRKRKLLEAAALIVSGIFFAAAFPDMNWSLLAWFGLLPLYLIVRERRAWGAFQGGYLWGFAWGATAFYWIGEIEYFNPPFRPVVLWIKNYVPVFNGGLCLPFLLAIALACFTAVWAWVLPWLHRYLLAPPEVQLEGYDAERRNQPKLTREILLIFTLAAWWVIVEWIRSWIFKGLPWNYLATTQWRNLTLIQVCEFTGMYGVSFIVALINFALALGVANGVKAYVNEGRYRRPWPFLIVMVILMVMVVGGWKLLRASQDLYRTAPVFRLAVIQGDIEQSRFAGGEKALEILDKYLMFSKIAAVSKPDAVIWPETAVPYSFRDREFFRTDYRETCRTYRERLCKLIDASKIPFVIGTIDYGEPTLDDMRTVPVHNSAMLIVPGKQQPETTYHKIHLVPFGEFVPLSKWFPILQQWIGMGRDLTAGTSYELIKIKPGLRAGVSICFEDVYAYVSRNEVLEGANFLLVLTNDAWYPTSSEPEQHLANSIFRAVENRRPMVRCGNNSCSALVTPEGYVADSVFKGFDKKFKQMIPEPARRGAGLAEFKVGVLADPPLTVYSRFGDWFVGACWVLFIISNLLCAWHWREKKQILTEKFIPAKE